MSAERRRNTNSTAPIDNMEHSDKPPTSIPHLRYMGPLRATVMRSNNSDRTRRQIVALAVDLDDLANSTSRSPERVGLYRSRIFTSQEGGSSCIPSSRA